MADLSVRVVDQTAESMKIIAVIDKATFSRKYPHDLRNLLSKLPGHEWADAQALLSANIETCTSRRFLQLTLGHVTRLSPSNECALPGA
jgi:transposase-like protein